MKWLVLLCLVFGLLAALAEDSQESGGKNNGGSVDYTSRYAELASVVPSHVNVPDLIASLSAASH